MAGRFSIEAVFKAIDKVSRPVSRMQTRVNRFTRSASRGFRSLNRTVNTFTRNIKRAAIITVAATALMSVGMMDVIRTGAEFEQTLVNAAAKFPEGIRRGSEEFAKLEAIARRTGATTEFTATQAAEGLNFLAMAGFNAVQSIAALPGVVDLATASAVDLGTAANIATDALGAFGLATKDPIQLTKNLARVNDVLAKTVTSANTDMAMLFETIKKGGPQVRASGSNIETFAALAGVMANSSLKASEAGSVIKNMFLRLSAPSSQAARLIRRFAGSVKDADGNLIDIVDILGNLDKGLEDLGTADKAAVLDAIFGKRAITGVNILLETGVEKLRAYRKELTGATGTLKTMASVMRDTTQGRINAMSSAFEGLKISLFLLNQEGIEGGIESLTGYIRIVDQAVKSNEALGRGIGRDLLDVLVGGAKIIGTVVVALLALKVALLAVNVVLGVVRITTALFTGAMVVARAVGLTWIVALVAGKLAVLALNVALLVARVTGLAWAASLVVSTVATQGTALATTLLASATGLLKVAYVLGRVVVLQWVAALAASRIAIIAQAALMPIFTGVMVVARAAMAAFNLVLVANPIGLFIAAVGLLIAAGALLVSQWGNVKKMFVVAWDAVTSATSAAMSSIRDSLGFILDPIMQVIDAVDGLKSKFKELDLFGDKTVKVKGVVSVDTPDISASALQPLKTATVSPAAKVKAPNVSASAQRVPGAVAAPLAAKVKAPDVGVSPTVRPTPTDNVVQMIAPIVKTRTINVERANNLLPFKALSPQSENTAPTPSPSVTPQVVSPQDRTARTIEERRTTETARLLIQDETGRATLERDNKGSQRFDIQLEQSGAA